MPQHGRERHGPKAAGAPQLAMIELGGIGRGWLAPLEHPFLPVIQVGEEQQGDEVITRWDGSLIPAVPAFPFIGDDGHGYKQKFDVEHET